MEDHDRDCECEECFQKFLDAETCSCCGCKVGFGCPAS